MKSPSGCYVGKSSILFRLCFSDYILPLFLRVCVYFDMRNKVYTYANVAYEFLFPTIKNENSIIYLLGFVLKVKTTMNQDLIYLSVQLKFRQKSTKCVKYT